MINFIAYDHINSILYAFQVVPDTADIGTNWTLEEFDTLQLALDRINELKLMPVTGLLIPDGVIIKWQTI